MSGVFPGIPAEDDDGGACLAVTEAGAFGGEHFPDFGEFGEVGVGDFLFVVFREEFQPEFVFVVGNVPVGGDAGDGGDDDLEGFAFLRRGRGEGGEAAAVGVEEWVDDDFGVFFTPDADEDELGRVFGFRLFEGDAVVEVDETAAGIGFLDVHFDLGIGREGRGEDGFLQLVVAELGFDQREPGFEVGSGEKFFEAGESEGSGVRAERSGSWRRGVVGWFHGSGRRGVTGGGSDRRW